jgi:hypothetical protein
LSLSFDGEFQAKGPTNACKLRGVQCTELEVPSGLMLVSERASLKLATLNITPLFLASSS